MRVIPNLFRNLFRKDRLDFDLDQELRSFVAMKADENIARGMPSDAARRAALVECGGVEQVKESVREVRAGVLLEQCWQDFRFAMRMLRKNPGFTAVAVLTLALGIGLNTIVFTAFDAVALRPLPVRDGATLVRLERWFASGRLGDSQYGYSWQEFLRLRDNAHSFAELIAVSFPVGAGVLTPENAASRSAPQAAALQFVTVNYFSHLGVNPELGRGFSAGEDSASSAVAVVSYPFWQRQLHGDAQVIGKTITINNTPMTIVGVTPRSFIGTANPPSVPDVWLPAAVLPQLIPGRDWLHDPRGGLFQVMGHLNPAATRLSAEAEVSQLVREFDKEYPLPEQNLTNVAATGTAVTTHVTLQTATLFGNTEDIRFKLLVALLMTIVGMVLIIACANLANMLLARATGRQREIGVRLAVGASRSRVLRQLLTESVVLAVLGGVAGLLLSVWAGRLLWSAAAPFLGNTLYAVPTTPDVRVFIYALGMSVITGVLFGVSPALQSARTDISSPLKGVGNAFGGQVRRSRLRGFLIGGQVAISLIFLISAGLLARGLVRSQNADPGYETKNIYILGLGFDADRNVSNIRARRVIDRLKLVPEVADVGIVERAPLMSTWSTYIEAVNPTGAAAPSETLANRVSSGYFSTLGIPLVLGRTFTRQEEQNALPVAVVSEAFARAAWPGQDPVGKMFKLRVTRNEGLDQFEIIGVAKDVSTANLSRLDPSMVYLVTPEADLTDYALLVRIHAGPSSRAGFARDGVESTPRQALSAIAAALASTDPRFATRFSPGNLEVDGVLPQKLMSRTLSLSAAALAGLALLLSAVGIYGVVSFVVSQMEHEVGIRMALGASGRQVLRLILHRGMRPVLIGGIVGLLGALFVAALMRAMLAFPASMDPFFGVGAFDPVTFTGVTTVLAVVALAACYVPARRAVKVDPMVALRYE